MSSKKRVFAFLLITALFLAACAPASRYTTDTGSARRRSRYYRTTPIAESIPPSGKVFQAGVVYNWVASYYGRDFHGRKTANGEIYDMYGMTCAHRELPFGTVLRVTNPVSNKTVTVRVNDRGPFIKGRDLDLSQGAAEAVGLIEKGVKELKVEITHLPE